MKEDIWFMSYMKLENIGESDWRRLDVLFESFIPEHREIWLFGLGLYADSFRKYLEACNVRISGYVVSNPSMETRVTDFPVLSIADFREYYNKSKPEKIGLLLTVGSAFHGEVYPHLMFLGKDLFFLNNTYMQMAVGHCGSVDKIVLGVRLTQNCKGIACYGCTAAAPVVKGLRVYDFGKFRKDLAKMKEVIGKRISKINFTGGDVFSHPNLVEIVEYTRKLFPDVRISFSINGVLLRE